MHAKEYSLRDLRRGRSLILMKLRVVQGLVHMRSCSCYSVLVYRVMNEATGLRTPDMWQSIKLCGRRASCKNISRIVLP